MKETNVAHRPDANTGKLKVLVGDAALGGFLPTSEMAERLCVTPPTLIKWAKEDGKIPFIQLDRKILWHVESVTQAMLRLQRNNGSAL